MNFMPSQSSKWNNLKRIHTAIRNQIKVKVDDIHINYETSAAKEGKVVLVLPGALGCCKTDFAPQLKSLSSKNLKAIFWDPPGYGESRPPKRDFSGNFFLRDAHLAAKLMKTLNYHSYSLLGWSDGGITALQMALSFPDCIEKLVIWGANAYIDENDLKLYNNIRDVNIWSEKMRNPMENIYGREYFKSTWENWIDAMTRLHQVNNGNILEGNLSQISCPTLIIHGKKDPMVGEYHAHYLHENIKESELFIMEDGKHNLHLKYAEKFNDLVAKFLHK